MKSSVTKDTTVIESWAGKASKIMSRLLSSLYKQVHPDFMQ